MRVLESWILSYLLNSLWQVPLLFFAGWLAARIMRRAGAAAEHRIWVTVLLLQALLPAVSLLPWDRLSWQWLLAIAGRGDPSGRDHAHVTVVMGTAAAQAGIHLPGTLLSLALVVYGAVSFYLIARFVWRARMLSLLRSEAVEVPLSGEAEQFRSRCAQQFGVGHVCIAASSRIAGPVTLGHAHKLVLLPATMAGTLPDDDLCAVIAHEFAHMRRNDFTKNLLYELVSLPVAYHPLLRLTQEQITETREMVCDRMAADINGRTHYGRSLLRLASLLVQGTPARTPHAIGIFDANTFERRLMKLTEVTNELGGTRRMTLLVACAVLGIATCGTAVALRTDLNAGQAAGESSPAKTPKKVMIASGIMAGQKLSGDNPVYPVEAKKAKIQGKVVLDAVISKEGNIENLRIVSGPKELQASSLDAVRTWKYKPYMLNGDYVDVETTINVTYALGG